MHLHRTPFTPEGDLCKILLTTRYMDEDQQQKIAAIQNEILKEISTKSSMKGVIFDQCLSAFNEFKEVLSEISNDLNDLLESTPGVNSRRVRLEYRDRGKFEAELKFADDVLVFTMHSDVFIFDRNHPVWDSDYVKGNRDNAYCGIISVYNFLYDSLKYNRTEDLGYLVARIFVNRGKAFFVEGKKQVWQDVKAFGMDILGRNEIKTIILSAVRYALSFDLLVPPYEVVKEAEVEDVNSRQDTAMFKTAKRLGFGFNTDDILK